MTECKNKKLLVITVEEILLLAVWGGAKDRADYNYGRGLSSARIFLRPCLREFLDFCFSNYRVGLWSEYSSELVLDALKRVYGDDWSTDKLEFILTSDDLVPVSDCRYDVEGMFSLRSRCKSLDVIISKGYPEEDIIIIDHDPKRWEPHGEIPRECWVFAGRIHQMFGNIKIDGEHFDRADRSLMEVWEELSSVQ